MSNKCKSSLKFVFSRKISRGYCKLLEMFVHFFVSVSWDTAAYNDNISGTLYCMHRCLVCTNGSHHFVHNSSNILEDDYKKKSCELLVNSLIVNYLSIASHVHLNVISFLILQALCNVDTINTIMDYTIKRFTNGVFVQNIVLCTMIQDTIVTELL